MTPMTDIQLHRRIGLLIRYALYQMPDGWNCN
jgi:hypothetical protein